MARFMRAIHAVHLAPGCSRVMDGPDKPGHDEVRRVMAAIDVQKIECEVTFLSKSDNGWGRDVIPILNGNFYRPHLVVGDPDQRKAILKTHTYEIENADGLKS